MKPPFALLGSALLALFLSGCSIGFSREWREAAKSDSTLHPTSIEGAWEGTWRSVPSGHRGKLKAVVKATPAGDGKASHAATLYDVTYHATWGVVFSGTFSTQHHAKPSPTAKGTLDLHGEKDLGMLGGVYSFTGSATPSSLNADYKSKLDHGVFELKRPGGKR